MTLEFEQLGLRLKGLREACDVSAQEMADDLDVTVEKYTSYEETGADVPISVLYHVAHKFGVDLTEILTGSNAKLDTFQVVRQGAGLVVDRYPGYHFQDLAWRYSKKIMQPLLVTLDPSDEPAKLVTHSGQEFNLVLEGAVKLTFDDKEVVLETGDSVYFNPLHRHGQACAGTTPAKFVTVIAE